MTNAFKVVNEFEQALCKYTSAPFAVAVDTGTAALFLCFRYLWERARDARYADDFDVTDRTPPYVASMPSRTFISVPMAAIQANWQIKWARQRNRWAGRRPQTYAIDFPEEEEGFPVVWDAALYFAPKLYQEHVIYKMNGTMPFICCSFQYRKHLAIGRGGAILHSDPEADEWFRRARFFGRHEVPMADEPGPTMLGWNMYMEPTRAAAGLSLLMHAPSPEESVRPLQVLYPDLSKYEVFKPYVVD